ncbi:Decapping nuclease DXO-like, chloroplastic [Porphyridium purpureum]|uniref:Decapping nuclease n=1 Tax=Porphyridium purpureum TaxID=35688 RepID=A0A5J4YKJ7_PORPP|nr:Decapping nuclease DXO-like, chloroplastic [Porphyridium purpureum]|eukprot:POR8298..scf244_11
MKGSAFVHGLVEMGMKGPRPFASSLSSGYVDNSRASFDVAGWRRRNMGKSNMMNDQRLLISEPREVACYSRTASFAYLLNDRSALRTYCAPRELPCDLNVGFDDYIKDRHRSEPVSDARGAPKDACVSNVLDAILERLGSQSLANIDVISYRNNLNKIGLTPYNSRDAWHIDACLLERTLVLQIVMLPEPDAQPSQLRFEYYGYRFEQIATTRVSEHEERGDTVDAQHGEEFCSIVNFRLREARIALAAEIDCKETGIVRGHGAGSRANYTELKTSRVMENDRQRNNFYRYKAIKYWIQSYLAGVQTIRVGFRDDNGMLLRIEEMNTQSLASRSPNSPLRHVAWDKFVCLQFMDDFLRFMRAELELEVERSQRNAAAPSEPSIPCLRFSFIPDRACIMVSHASPDFHLLALQMHAKVKP